ncbi:hypothetical protein G3N56_15225 [Desulfovibrio sulfodismutans]|uniref:Cys-rich protein n=1 Tax=Desulfolutivibrio sulfodismutans TaxID=63561 RepID=A0A7K3NPG4_9BACT|nr:hypothetical protein [Desulfolutivibrio sulfodismutans]NDY58086.1 hypothetical protein [Desulfolutivibrio sulfodismutans]QLA13292.1 hypothetical protein GD606_13990 [Desulfolutivibrio sulfodismutans DSM 3696]
MRCLILSCLILSCLAGSGCVSKQTMSLSSFRGLCLASGGEKTSSCFSMDICYPLADLLEKEPGSLGRCLDICRDYAASLAQGSVMNQCASMVNMAQNQCIKYCRINYEP